MFLPEVGENFPKGQSLYTHTSFGTWLCSKILLPTKGLGRISWKRWRFEAIVSRGRIDSLLEDNDLKIVRETGFSGFLGKQRFCPVHRLPWIVLLYCYMISGVSIYIKCRVKVPSAVLWLSVPGKDLVRRWL